MDTANAGAGNLQRELEEFVFPLTNIRQCVAINLCGRSGSFLLHSLFDGHANFVTPSPLSPINNPWNCFRLTAKALLDLGLAGDGMFGPEQFARATLNVIDTLSQDQRVVPDNDPGLRDPEVRERFIACFVQLVIEQGSEKLKFGFFVRALLVANSFAHRMRINSANPIITIQQHNNVALTTVLLQSFEKVFFLFATRLPTKGIDSLIRHCWVESDWTSINWPPDEIFERVMTAKYRFDLSNFLDKNTLNSATATLAEFWAIRLEDMHHTPMLVTRAICARLSVNWDTAMLESTVYGKPLLFPKRTSQGKVEFVRGLSPTNAKVGDFWGFNGLDRRRLECIYFAVYRGWQYPLPRSVDRPWYRRTVLLLLWIPFLCELRGWARSACQFSEISWTRRKEVFLKWVRDYRKTRVHLRFLAKNLAARKNAIIPLLPIPES